MTKVFISGLIRFYPIILCSAEYCAQVLGPQCKKDMWLESREGPGRARKVIRELKHLSYEDKLLS